MELRLWNARTRYRSGPRAQLVVFGGAWDRPPEDASPCEDELFRGNSSWSAVGSIAGGEVIVFGMGATCHSRSLSDPRQVRPCDTELVYSTRDPSPPEHEAVM